MQNNMVSNNVPVKYNGDYLDGLKIGFFCDLLILNLVGCPDIMDGNSFKFSVREYGNKVFTYMVDVECNNQKFGILYLHPRNSVNAKDLVQFRFDNNTLYTMSSFDRLQKMKRLLNYLNLEFKGVSKMDLALDYTDDKGITEKIIKSILNGKIRVSGREKVLKPFSKSKNGVVFYNGLHVGHRGNSRFLRLYNKTLELEQVGEKEYIRQCWDFLEMKGEIWRYEYSLTSRFFKNLKDVTLDNIFNLNWLLSLLEMAKTNHFDLHFNTGKTETNKELKINFMSFDVVRRLVKSTYIHIKKVAKTIKETLIGQKRIIKGLLRSYVSRGQDARYLSPIKAYVDDHDLKDWFYDRLQMYLHEFKRAQIIKRFDYQQFRKDFSYVTGN